MAGKPSSPVAVFPIIVLAINVLGLLCVAENQARSPKNFSKWVASNVASFKERMAQIENVTRVALDERLAGAEAQRRVIKVRQDGTGDFRTISDAVKSIPLGNSRRVVVHIGPGVYKEKVTVEKSKPFVTFLGDPNAMPTITFDDTAAKFGTWLSASVAVDSHYFMAANIIFKNAAPKPAAGAQSQAVAMRISGDKAAFYNCRFYGYQDTLLDDKGRHFFKDCYIEGSVDFIFGSGRSLYRNCEIRSVSDYPGQTAIVAQGKSSKGDKSGFVFLDCHVTGMGDVYLSRAWREYSRVVFAYSYFDTVVNPEGWNDKGFTERDKTVFYGEYKCEGPGANTNRRVDYVKLLTDAQAKPFLDESFIRGRTWILPPPTL
ncbi:putative pectinesterase 63 [Amborella trichopoda]|uniref:putative pectinesterase 63 n=1 Tax=Amborella trichopoda TaxID=13333 RepID=UPI0005D45BB9|nr:putative pectinesterase 63 [Amborella trichopoda]|eukprot:XP_006843863.2 putative pectinesterase 63 [Amborella trichopoda]